MHRASPTRRGRSPDSGGGWRLPATLLVLLLASWLALRALPPAWVDEVWAARWLPPASAATAAWIDALPWSLTALAAVGWLGLVVALAIAGPGGTRAARLTWAAVALLALGPGFELAWGMGYRRTPLEGLLRLPPTPPTAADAWGALERLAAVVDASAPRDTTRVELGAAWPPAAFAAASACVAQADALTTGRPEPLRLPAGVRRLPAGLLLQGGFSGFQAPWWREPHLDGGLPPMAALAVALHEFTHAAGWAREAETDALAVLAGLACDHPDVRFAAAAHALLLVRSELGRVAADEAAWRERLADTWATLPLAAHATWSATSAAIARHRSAPITRAATVAYDAYLRGQGVTAGVADYGRAGVLVVAALARCEDDGTPPWCVAGGAD